MALYNCEFNFSNNPHLSQIYAGFEQLEAQGIVNLKVRFTKKITDPVLEVVVNDSVKVVYDLMDGYNWIEGSKEENVEYFLKNYAADICFKRSYDASVFGKRKRNVHPLGLNYPIGVKHLHKRHIKFKAKTILRKALALSGFSSERPVYYEDFEYSPVRNAEDRILFQTRLWNPDDAVSKEAKQEREEMNSNRVECVRLCKKEFGKLFTGGITPDEYSLKHVPALVLPAEVTSKTKYLQTIRQHNICISTTGLHGSIGWKLGEYVTAARAIISEPLNYQVPGNFEENKNYLSFRNATELVDAVVALKTDSQKLQAMMNENHAYYLEYLQPAKLILNTLKKIEL